MVEVLLRSDGGRRSPAAEHNFYWRLLYKDGVLGDGFLDEPLPGGTILDSPPNPVALQVTTHVLSDGNRDQRTVRAGIGQVDFANIPGDAPGGPWRPIFTRKRGISIKTTMGGYVEGTSAIKTSATIFGRGRETDTTIEGRVWVAMFHDGEHLDTEGKQCPQRGFHTHNVPAKLARSQNGAIERLVREGHRSG